MNKKQLYDHIMKNVAIEVKKALNENTYWDEPINNELNDIYREPKVGDKIRIIRLVDELDDKYVGREGIIKYIDDIGQLHGTWGGLAVIPEVDEFEYID